MNRIRSLLSPAAFISTLLLTLAVTLSSAAAAGFTAIANMELARVYHTATFLPSGKVLIAGGYAGISALSAARLYDPATGAFTPAGSMTYSRFKHTATLLPNGKVLIAGGDTVTTARGSAELFDPVTRAFTGTGSMAFPRYNHTATLLPNGKVLIAGGYSGNTNGFRASVELYDPATGTFSTVTSLGTVRDFHTATLLPSGKILFAGGENATGYLAGAELYDPTTGTTTALTMKKTHYRHSATLLPNGKVLIAGGYNSSGYQTDAELFDPADNTFTITGSLTDARDIHTATLLPSGMVLITGGHNSSGELASAELYNPVTGLFTATGSMSDQRYGHTATLLPDGTVFIAGGYNVSSYLASAELYSQVAGSFTATGSMTTARSYHTATLLPSGKVLIAGGQNSGLALADAMLYDPATGVFTATIGSMTTARYGHSATLLPNGTVFIAGGYTGSAALATAELYDPATGLFTATVGSMTAARAYHSATLLPNGKVVIAGGYTGTGYLASIVLYDPATGLFTANSRSLATARGYHTATLLNNGRVIIAGGYNGSYLASAELYTPSSVNMSSTTMALTHAYHTATLLPTGEVLVAGGYNGSSSLADAELYDPIAGTFTVTGSMAGMRNTHTATLLSGGKLLIAGGQYPNGTALTGADQYDSITGVFTATGSMPAARYGHTATLLPDGKVLITGGKNGSDLADALLYDPGLGFSDSWRPTISGLAFDPGSPARLTISGSGFKGLSEASGGASNSSATNYPLFYLQRMDNDQFSFIQSDSATTWSDTAFTSVSVYGLPLGTYRASVYTNAIPSQQQLLVIAPSVRVSPTSLAFGSVSTGNSSAPQTITITNNGAADLINSAATAGTHFSVGAGTCGTLPKTLAPAASCTVTATFSPTSGGDLSTNLVITTNDPATPQATVALSGTGVSPTIPLTVAFAGAGSGTVAGTTTGTPATVSYPTAGSTSISGGAIVTLTPTATTNSAFAAWSGCDTVNNDVCTVTMNAARSVTVSFKTLDKLIPTLSVTTSPQTYNGSAQAAAVSGSVAGVVANVRYNGAATVPSNAGVYAVTADFTPANTATYATLTGAAAGNFSINKATPTLTVTNSPVTYNGSPRAATVSGSVAGAVTRIKYGGFATVPTTSGTYAVTADFTPTDSTNYASLTGAAAGSFIINKATPTLTVTNSPATYSGSPQAATVSGSVAGAVASIKCGGSATLPTTVGTYAVTADFTPTDSTNYASLTGAAAGNFTISKATPTLTVTNSPVMYNGSPQAATVSGSVAGSVTSIKYGGSATVPTTAGTYAVTANFTPTDSANYASLTGAAAGNFIISKATPTLSVTNSPQIYNGSPKTSAVVSSKAGSIINIKYNGSSTVPSALGTYAITADFAPTDLINYRSLTKTSVGNFVIKSPSTISVTVQSNPAGRSILIDGNTFNATQTFTWEVGSSHTLEVISEPQVLSPGTRQVFDSWSDGGARSHSITVPANATTYTAIFTTEHQVDTAIAPSVPTNDKIGSVSPPRGNWYKEGTVVEFKAFPESGLDVDSWTGLPPGPPVVVIDKPISAVCSVAPAPVLASNITAKSGTINARKWHTTVKNEGKKIAPSSKITDLTVTQVSGKACTPVIDPAQFPIDLGDIAANASVTKQVQIDFTGCPPSASFEVNVTSHAGSPTLIPKSIGIQIGGGGGGFTKKTVIKK